MKEWEYKDFMHKKIYDSMLEPYIDYKLDENDKNKLEGIFIKKFDPQKYLDIRAIFSEDIKYLKQEKIKIHIQDKIEIIGDKGEVLYDFSNCIFQEEVNIDECKGFNADFQNSVFTKKVKFPDSSLAKCIFDNAVFEDDLILGRQSLNDSSFINCIFKGYAKFKSTNRNVFTNSTFKNNTDFYSISDSEFENVNFERNLKISSKINKVNFSNTEFKYLAKFSKIEFEDEINFSHCTFHEQVQFINISPTDSAYINFEKAKFKQSLDLSRSNLFKANLRFWGVEIEPIPDRLSLYSSDIISEKEQNEDNKYLSFQRMRETYRLIKQFFKNENNFIDALQFQQYEMSAYQKELHYKKSGEDFWNRKLLWLNKVSNNFGASWSRGILFTFLVAVFIYSLFLICNSSNLVFDFSGDAISATINHFFEFLNITDWDIKPFGIKNASLYIILFLGRIFIGYGYYQTVQAFRKYRNN